MYNPSVTISDADEKAHQDTDISVFVQGIVTDIPLVLAFDLPTKMLGVFTSSKTHSGQQLKKQVKKK